MDRNAPPIATPVSSQQAEEILAALMAWYITYRKDRLHRSHLAVLTNAAVRICCHYPEHYNKFALPMVIKQAQGDDQDDARTALETWHRSSTNTPALKLIFVRELLAYFRRFAQNHDEQYGRDYDQDRRLLRALDDAATSDLAVQQAAMQAVVVAHGPHAGYRGLYFVSVLVQHELYDAAATCADALAGATSSDPRGLWVRDQALLLKAAARTEATLALGDATAALALLQAEDARLAQFTPKTDATDSKEIVDALSMAHKISSRLR